MTILSDPATFLYLNPSLQANGLALTVEDAITLWQGGDPYIRSLATALPLLPTNYDPLSYLSENRGTLDVSTLNGTIFSALSNTGRNVADIRKQATYSPTIYKTATLASPNTFVFDDKKFTISACNLRVKDQVKIGVNSNRDSIFGTVTSVDTSAGVFSVVSANRRPITDSNANYLVTGIRLYDARRLALISMARRYSHHYYGTATGSATDSGTNVVVFQQSPLERDFELDLYHVLYPETRFMNETEAYADFISNRDAGRYRATKGSDILNTNTPNTGLQNAEITETLTVGGSQAFVLNGLQRVMTLHGAFVGDSVDVGSSNLTADSQLVNVANHFQAGTGALLVSPDVITVTVPSSFGSNVSLTASLEVGGDVVIACGVSVGGSVFVQSDSSAERFLAWSSIGIGASSGFFGTDTPQTLSSASYTNTRTSAQTFAPHNPSSRTSTSTNEGANTSTRGTGSGSRSLVTDSLPDPFEVGTLVADTTIVIGAGPWTLTELPSPDGEGGGEGALCVRHPSLGEYSHVFDTSGRVGFNVAATGGAGGLPLQYGVVINGDMFTTGTVISQSDARKKSGLRVIESAMDRITRLTGYTYDTESQIGDITNTTTKKKRCTGLLAQDVLTAIPEAVHADSGGMLSVAYGNLAGLFVEAIKELRDEVKDLRHQLHNFNLSGV